MTLKQKIKISQGHIIDPYNKIDQQSDIYIADGKIAAIHSHRSNKQDEPFKADLEIDACDCIISPSFIDLNVHLREPGFEKKATITSELSAAVSAGVGHLACIPTCQPTIDTSAVASLILEKAAKCNQSRVYPIGALTAGMQGEQLSEMKSLVDAGCVALSNYYQPIKNLNVLSHCYEYAATFDIPIFIYPQIHELAKDGCAHEGKWSTVLGLPAIPEAAETIAVSTHLLLIEKTGIKAHFSQLSTARAVELIKQAQAQGLNVTADVAAHQLFLDDSSLQTFDSIYHLAPPLRSEQDLNGLRQGVIDGTISAICSSHQPLEAAAKFSPFASSETGISAIETLLPLAGLFAGETNLSRYDMVTRLTKGPAEIIGVEQTGIVEGNLADLCIFNTRQEWTLKVDDLISAGKNSPFIGAVFNDKVTHTFADGKLVFSTSDQQSR